MTLWLTLLLGCEVADKNTDTGVTNSQDSGTTPDTDTSPPWVPTGSGIAYYLDGVEANSLFTLEMGTVTPPPEDDSYAAYLMGTSITELYIGPVPVTETTLFWQSETGINALTSGYNRIEVRLINAGDVIYSGQVDPVVETTYQRLLISSPDTPDGDGSLREIEQTLETLIQHNTDTIALEGDMPAVHQGAEATVNTILGTSIDYNNDTIISTIPDLLPLIGESLAETDDLSNLRNLVLADLDAASLAAHQIAPTHHIKDLANYAYDCTQLIGTYVQQAANSADNVAGGITDEADCDTRLQESNLFLQYALDGFDVDENGRIEDLTEGTINCAIYYVSQMAYMEVGID